MTTYNFKTTGLLVTMMVFAFALQAQEYQPFEDNRPDNSLQEQKPFEDFDQHGIFEQNQAERVELTEEEGGSTRLYSSPGNNTRGGWVNGSPNAPEDPNDVPIDGGLSLLLAAGAAYGAKRYRDGRKRSGLEEQVDSR